MPAAAAAGVPVNGTDSSGTTSVATLAAVSTTRRAGNLMAFSFPGSGFPGQARDTCPETAGNNARPITVTCEPPLKQPISRGDHTHPRTKRSQGSCSAVTVPIANDQQIYTRTMPAS